MIFMGAPEAGSNGFACPLVPRAVAERPPRPRVVNARHPPQPGRPRALYQTGTLSRVVRRAGFPDSPEVVRILWRTGRISGTLVPRILPLRTSGIPLRG